MVQGRGSRSRARFARGLWAAAEITVTLGVVVLLLVAHQLWWTNRQAREGAERQVHALEKEWDGGMRGAEPPRQDAVEPTSPPDPEPDRPGGEEREESAPPGARAPRWDQAYAVLRIPRLGVVAPVAQGVGKKGVLDKGYVGHYPGSAQPGRPGNFAVAGHRNTHGEPFRHIDRLRDGDRIQIETREGIFVYEVDARIAQTSPRDTGVIRPVPRSLVTPSAGYSAPGYYVTLTTCTPEFSSKYRLVVWGKLASMRPR